jgi:hypothetical protein
MKMLPLIQEKEPNEVMLLPKTKVSQGFQALSVIGRFGIIQSGIRFTFF